MENQKAEMAVIRAGLALSLSVRISGGITYTRAGKEKETQGDGAVRERWETEKVTQNPDEYARAVALRANIRNSVTKICARTPLGDLLIVPPDREADLEAALAAARVAVEDHNRASAHHKVTIGAVPARLSADDKWTARSILGEILVCLGEIQRSIGGGEVDAIRDTCDKLVKLAPALTGEVAGFLTAGVDAARGAARDLKRRLAKGDEDPIEVVTEIQSIWGTRVDSAIASLMLYH